jgi:hypothetical protein
MKKSAWLRTTFASFACAAFSLAVLPAGADAVPASSGSYTLTQGMLNDTLEFWQILDGRPFTAADRQTMTAIDIDRFRHDPAWVTGVFRQVHKNLPGVRRSNAVDIAALRQVNLVDIYCTPQALHLTAEDAAKMQAVVAHYLPVAGVDAASGMVITERDLDSAAAASRFVAARTHSPNYSARLRSDLANLARTPAKLGPLAEHDLTDMDRNWAAFQMTWPHESPSYQAQMLNRVVPTLHQLAAKGQGETGLVVASLSLPELQYGDYPYALDPRLAAAKRASDARMSRFKTHMQEYLIMNQQRGMLNAARSMSGQAPEPDDYNPIPLPTP